MDKSLSQQICELAGLKKPIDFKNPENFVKLIELKINHITLSELLFLKCICIRNRLNFLDLLAFNLKNNFFDETNDAEQIKQSIRNYDGWVWG